MNDFELRLFLAAARQVKPTTEQKAAIWQRIQRAIEQQEQIN